MWNFCCIHIQMISVMMIMQLWHTDTILSLIYGTRSSEKYGTYHCHFVSPPGQYPTMYSDKEQVFNCIQRTIAALVYPVTSRFSCAWGYCTGDKTISLQ
uniref:Secreted protein n=1 Tax=Oncorhynchus tshawytscha TaxID=74940 RepID=A0A8C8BXI6_ONCTS